MGVVIPLEKAFIDRWRETLVADREASVRGHRCTLELCLYFDQQPLMLSIERGVLLGGELGPWHMRAADLTIWATHKTWQTFWQSQPPPGFHDLMAMSSFGHCRIEGDIDALRTHLGFIKSLMTAPRLFLPDTQLVGETS